MTSSNDLRRILTLWGVCLLLLSAFVPATRAGSLVKTHLASVEEVKVLLADGAMFYALGPDHRGKQSLEDARQQIESGLAEQGIKASQESPVYLIIEVSLSDKALPEDQRLLVARASLEEPATLSRNVGDSTVNVKTWYSDYWVFTEVAQASDKAAEVAAILAQELGQAVVESRANTHRDGSP